MWLVTLLVGSLAIAKGKDNSFMKSGYVNDRLRVIQKAIEQKRYFQAANELFLLRYQVPVSRQDQVVYLLGSALRKANYPVAAAVILAQLLNDPKSVYFEPAARQLIEVALQLKDDTLLEYVVIKLGNRKINQPILDAAVTLVQVEQALERKDIKSAWEKLTVIREFEVSNLPLLSYKKFLALLLMDKVDEALVLGQKLLRASEDPLSKQVMTLNLARALYQKGDYERAIDLYKSVPRNSQLWLQSLFEMAWAQLRAGRLRSALGTLQTLHSPFYDQEFYPESYVIRSIVYLYTCQFAEAQKVGLLFDKNLSSQVKKAKIWLKNPASIKDFMNALSMPNPDGARLVGLPLGLWTKAKDLPLVRQKHDIYRLVTAELNRWQKVSETSKDLYQYVQTAVQKRRKQVENAVYQAFLLGLKGLIDNFDELQEQMNFIRYETIVGLKEQVKKKLITGQLSSRIDEHLTREVYVAQGYEYWPFDSEFWLDELGNYYYLGVSQCQ